MNGNMIADHNKGITLIEYNEFNLPTKIHFSTDDASGKYIEYAYDATGTKQLKRVKNENQTGYHLTYYAGAFIYEKQITESTPSLKFIQQPDGYFEPTGTSPSGELEGAYTYQYKDHLGNIRLSYSDLDGNGVINPYTEIKEAKDYYAFGLEHSMPNKQIIGTRYPYGFNGKEENNELGLEWLDFGARNYDAALGRWMNIDPLAELMPDQSPYNYAFNNPVFWIDPDGRMPEGAQTSYGTDLSSAAGSFFGTTITGSNTSTDENGRKVTTDTKTYANTDAGREGLVNEMNEIRGSEEATNNTQNPIKGFFSLQLENFKKLKIQIGLEWENKSNKHFDLSGKASLDATFGKNGVNMIASLEGSMSYGDENIKGVASFKQGIGLMNNSVYTYENKYITTNIYLNFKQQSNDKIYDSFARMMLSYSPVQPITYHFQSRINGGLNPRGGFQLDLKSSTTDFKTVNQDITLKRLMFYYKYAHLFNK